MQTILANLSQGSYFMFQPLKQQHKRPSEQLHWHCKVNGLKLCGHALPFF